MTGQLLKQYKERSKEITVYTIVKTNINTGNVVQKFDGFKSKKEAEQEARWFTEDEEEDSGFFRYEVIKE